MDFTAILIILGSGVVRTHTLRRLGKILGMKIQAGPNLKKSIKSLMPPILLSMLRTINAIAHFKGSEHVAKFALRIRARGPSSTFEKKILRKMVFDRNPMMMIYADKVKVREFVRQRVGEKYLTISFGEFLSLKSLNRSTLPKNFVLKSNHGSGGSVICWERAPRGTKISKNLSNVSWEKYLIHPDDLDWQDLVNLSNKWMRLNFFWTPGRFPEWAYKGIKPMILAEELLLENNDLPSDYKFHMIDGKCAFIQVDVARYGHHQRNLYSEDWKLLNARTSHPPVSDFLPSPSSLSEMLKVAQDISKGIDFIRVDLYAISGRVIFGEMTNYPNGGLAEIWPKSLNIELAKNWVQNY